MLIDEKDKDNTACNHSNESGENEVVAIHGVKWCPVRRGLVSLVNWKGYEGVYEEEISNLDTYPEPFSEKLFILS